MSRRTPRRFGVLKERNLRLMLSAGAISELGDGIATIAVAFAVLDTFHSPAALGLVFACRGVALLASVLVGGVVGDRANRKFLMVAADSARLLAQATVGASLLFAHATLVELSASQIVLGLASGVFAPAWSGLMPTAAGKHITAGG